MYDCPNCNAPLKPGEVEEFDGGSGTDDMQHHHFDCPKCGRRVFVTCHIEVEYTLDGDGKETEDYDPTLIRLALLDNRLRVPEDFFTVSPEKVFMADDPVCTVCGARESRCRCAADLMGKGWRVIQEFPGLRATCPNCYGG